MPSLSRTETEKGQRLSVCARAGHQRKPRRCHHLPHFGLNCSHQVLMWTFHLAKVIRRDWLRCPDFCCSVAACRAQSSRPSPRQRLSAPSLRGCGKTSSLWVLDSSDAATSHDVWPKEPDRAMSQSGQSLCQKSLKGCFRDVNGASRRESGERMGFVSEQHGQAQSGGGQWAAGIPCQQTFLNLHRFA